MPEALPAGRESLHQPSEGHLLKAQGLGHIVPNPRRQLAHGWVPGRVHGQRQGIGEVTNQAFQLSGLAARRGSADQQPVLAAEASEKPSP